MILRIGEYTERIHANGVPKRLYMATRKRTNDSPKATKYPKVPTVPGAPPKTPLTTRASARQTRNQLPANGPRYSKPHPSVSTLKRLSERHPPLGDFGRHVLFFCAMTAAPEK
jgi:hypothetical protein